MSCERLQKWPLFFALSIVVACAQEDPAPGEPIKPTTTVATPTLPPKPAATYDEAVRWFRTTPGFQFNVEEGGVHAIGEMSREILGAERVKVTVNDQTWAAAAGPSGVTWQRDEKDVDAPPWGNRLFQRVTVAFDPQKQEGLATLVEPGHFRFTDANSGNVHDVWVNDEGQITRMKIGSAVSMSFTGQR